MNVIDNRLFKYIERNEKLLKRYLSIFKNNYLKGELRGHLILYSKNDYGYGFSIVDSSMEYIKITFIRNFSKKRSIYEIQIHLDLEEESHIKISVPNQFIESMPEQMINEMENYKM
tara:strand:+ start:1564 stop:1911 length:348 start_codon:yes stop_codon:yes gene_type:complete